MVNRVADDGSDAATRKRWLAKPQLGLAVARARARTAEFSVTGLCKMVPEEEGATGPAAWARANGASGVKP